MWQWGSAFLILLAVSVGIWYYWTHRSLPPEEIYEKYQKSVVLIYQKTAYVASVGDKLLGEYMEMIRGIISIWTIKMMCVKE